MSHPGFMVLCPPIQSAGQLEGKCYEHTWVEGYIHLPLQLQPGEEASLPIYIRGTLEGQHHMGLLLKYEPVVPAVPTSTGSTLPAPTGPKHRLAYLTFPLLVTPLFALKVFTRPSFQQLEDSLLGLELQDKQQTIPGITWYSRICWIEGVGGEENDVCYSGVSVLSKMWTIAPLLQNQKDNGAGVQEGYHEQHAGLNAPRKLHSSVSSPAVSALKSDTSSHLPVPSPSHALPSPRSNGKSPTSLPSSHILRPYESLLQFFRVTNLPGSFGHAPEKKDASTSAGAAGQQKHVHQSASANNLAKELASKDGAKRAIHVSSVPLSASFGSALLIDPSHPAIAHLLHMEKALLIEEEKQTLIVNPAAVLADVGAANRLDLVCAWRDALGERSGFFHAPGLASMKSAPSACSLKVLLGFPRHVTHDFTFRSGIAGGGLDVPVSVSIRNTLEDAPVTFSFETLPPEEEFDAVKRSFRVSQSQSWKGRYMWSGSTRCRVAELPAGERVAITLFASFPSPGVYNLNRFRFTVEQVGKKPRVFFFPLQHLIHITQASQKQTELAVSTQDTTTSITKEPASDSTEDLSASQPHSDSSAMQTHQLEAVEEVADVGASAEPPAFQSQAGNDEIAEAPTQQDPQDDDQTQTYHDEQAIRAQV